MRGRYASANTNRVPLGLILERLAGGRGEFTWDRLWDARARIQEALDGVGGD